MTYEEAEDERWREAMWKIIDAPKPTFKEAFEKLASMKRPASKMICSSALLAELTNGQPVHCGHCDDTCLVESLYDQGPGCCPCFEDCPAIDEPWHVKR